MKVCLRNHSQPGIQLIDTLFVYGGPSIGERKCWYAPGTFISKNSHLRRWLALITMAISGGTLRYQQVGEYLVKKVDTEIWSGFTGVKPKRNIRFFADQPS
ncbi:uncharacterized protein LOC114880552 [Osmia bicornis bicornis]|uniref:uncharacterized protein LOC114880552 n=1 Tax=Osmia bicornis bicornis TaxID=1437191 RepID=UPI001EAEA1A0|nr:uncharacterized protein LOC114880552 [Osmia bicornis bicornis]